MVRAVSCFLRSLQITKSDHDTTISDRVISGSQHRQKPKVERQWIRVGEMDD